jgi:tetratricopeptide (TPR) repeat protein
MFTPDGRRLVTVAHAEPSRIQLGALIDLHGPMIVRTWDAERGLPLTEPFLLENSILSAGLRPDGLMLATACSDRAVRLWDTGTGRPVLVITEFAGAPRMCSFSQDGKKLLVVSTDEIGAATTAIYAGDGVSWGEARIWNAVTGAPISPPMRHRNIIIYAEFSADGAHIVTASKDGTARVWDAVTGEPETAPLAHTFGLTKASFSRDGRRVVTTSGDYTARVWDAVTGEPLGPPYQHRGSVDAVAFCPDGYQFATAPREPRESVTVQTTAHLWRLAVDPRPLEDLQLVTKLLSSQRIDATGSLIPLEAEEFPKLWRLLKRKYPDQFGHTLEAPLAWRWRQLETTEEIKRRPSDLLHLKCILASETNQARYLSACALLFPRQGRWTEAAQSLSKALELTPTDSGIWYQLAPLLLQTGDLSGYQKHCRAMLARFSGTGDRTLARRIAKACLLLPLPAADLAAIEKLADTGVSESGLWRGEFSKGLAEYRQDRFASAIEWMKKSLAAPVAARRDVDAQAWFVLAMAQQRLGRFEEARAALAKGVESVKKEVSTLESGDLGQYWLDWIVTHLLMSEAQALIEEKAAAETDAFRAKE